MQSAANNMQLFNFFKVALTRISRFSHYSLVYDKFGDPHTCINLVTSNITESFVDQVVLSGKIFVKILASPINPADINKIQGNYAMKAKIPIVGGTEAVGQVINAPKFSKFNAGDKVIFVGDHFTQTWQNYGFYDPKNLFKVPEIHTLSASMLLVNPCTAYHLLKSFVNLKPGDTIIQNGANSSVGQFIIQLSHIFGINTINIVRNRKNIDQLIGYLQILGANSVIVDEQLKSSQTKEIIDKYNPVKLALNCIGGENCLNMISYLEKSGTLITYGGMSKKPVIIPTKYFIFNDLKAFGFMLSDYNNSNIESTLNEICGFFKKKQLSPPLCKTFKLSQFKEAFEYTLQPYNMEKSIFIFDHHN